MLIQDIILNNYMNKKQHFTSLDSLRGFAALFVVFLHSYWSHDFYFLNFIRNSYLFVDLFFILSGFVIIYNYHDKLLYNSISIKQFVLKRFYRLWPLHFSILLVFLFLEFIKFIFFTHFGISGTNIPFSENNGIAFFANLFFLQSFNTFQDATFNGPSWSISVEFFTYIFFAVSIIIFKNKINLYKYFSLIVIIISSYFLYFKIGHLSVTHDFGFIRCLFGFFSGIIIFYLYNASLNSHSRIKNINYFTWTIIELSTIFFLIYSLSWKDEVNRLDFISFVLFFIMIYLFIFSKGLISKLLNYRLFTYLGKISFSIYMVHYFYSILLNNFLKIYYKAPFINDKWGGYVEINPTVGNIYLIFYLIIVIISAHYTYEFIEQRYRHGFLKKKSFNK